MKISNRFESFIKDNPSKFIERFDNTVKVAGGMVIGGMLMMCGAHTERERLVSEIKEQVKETGISKKDFKKLDDSITFWNTRNEAVAWQHALDSIQMKGQSDKASFEVRQKIRK